MNCVILATEDQAGAQPGEFRPLWRLHGLSLLERAVLTARRAGCRRILVVATREIDRVRDQLADWALAWRPDVELELVTPSGTEQGGAATALAALRGVLSEPFLLFGADRLFDPRLLETLADHDPAGRLVTLAVDSERENPVVDPDRAVRVRRLGDQVEDLGRHLEWYDGLATGLMMVDPGFLERLPMTREQELEAIVRALALEGQVGSLDVSGRFWCPVDDARRLKKCGRAFLRHVRTDLEDGPVARWFNRPFSIQLSRLLARFRVRPAQMAAVAFGLSALAAWLLARGDYPHLVAGGLLAQLAVMVGGSDSELARLRLLSEGYGGWLRRLWDHYADSLLLLGAAWPWLGQSRPGAVVAYLALAGVAALALTAGRYRRCLVGRRSALSWWLGRDARTFILLLGALGDRVLPALVVIALLAHLETLRRVLVCELSGSSGSDQRN